jgi:hypothetical protein
MEPQNAIRLNAIQQQEPFIDDEVDPTTGTFAGHPVSSRPAIISSGTAPQRPAQAEA